MPRERRPSPEPRRRDEWKRPGDWRFADDLGPDGVEVLAPPPAELVDHQAGAVEVLEPAIAAAPEPWPGPTSPSASGPRKITPEVLARAARLHEAGLSWPAIAREIGCHRMALYHARRRARA